MIDMRAVFGRDVVALSQFAPIQIHEISKLAQELVMAQKRFTRWSFKMTAKGLAVGRRRQQARCRRGGAS
jgi:hypothetical protein